MDNLTCSTNPTENFFYKYENLKAVVGDNGKVIRDDNGNDVIYAIQNLVNNQLYFNNPTKFNDPFDCKFVLDHIGTREQWITHFKTMEHNQRKATMLFNEKKKGRILTEIHDNLYSYDYIKDVELDIKLGRLNKEDYLVYQDSIGKSRKQIGIDMNDYLRSKALPLVCCFSGTGENVLLWSHYADYHRGICLKFKPYKHIFEVNENSAINYFIEIGVIEPGKEHPLLDLFSPTTNKIVSSEIFRKVGYKDEPPGSINFFDALKNDKVFEFLLTKFKNWNYEDEYRIMIDTRYLEQSTLKYRKQDLEGVIFGLKITYEKAKLVYDTVKQNYLDEGISLNFYEAKEVIGKYEIKLEHISDIEEYLDSLK